MARLEDIPLKNIDMYTDDCTVSGYWSDKTGAGLVLYNTKTKETFRVHLINC